jgi:hypothetical protein
MKRSKIAAVAKRLGHRKVTRSITLDSVLWREIEYIAHDCGYGNAYTFLEQYAFESLEIVAQFKKERVEEEKLNK